MLRGRGGVSGCAHLSGDWSVLRGGGGVSGCGTFEWRLVSVNGRGD